MSTAKTMLLVVDVQRGFINSCTEKVIGIIEKAVKELQYDVCVYSKFRNSKGTSFSRILNWSKLQSADEQELILPIQGNIVVPKNTYSAVTNHLRQIIKEGEYTTVYLCGIDTDSCVLATAFDLFDYGIEPKVIIDGCASTGGKDYHHAAEMIMRRSFGKDNVNNLSYYIGGKK